MDEEKVLKDFHEKLKNFQEDLDPKFKKFVDEHFWELVDLPKDEPAE